MHCIRELKKVIHVYLAQPTLAAADDPSLGILYDHDAFIAGLAIECERAVRQMIADEIVELAKESDHVAQDVLFQAAYTALQSDADFLIDNAAGAGEK